VFPATVSVPVRLDDVPFAATAYVIVPGPVVAVPFVIVIQDAFEIAVHAHPLDVVTVTSPDPPEGASEAVSGPTE